MHLKQFYNIATKVSSKNNATTFGDLPDVRRTPKFIDKFFFKIQVKHVNNKSTEYYISPFTDLEALGYILLQKFYYCEETNIWN